MDAPKEWEYCTLNWIWSDSDIRLTLPNVEESFEKGNHKEIVQMLTNLGKDGWEIVGCVGVANWILWTLKRPIR
ncbi:hypothetical protein ACFLXQ_03270 [Chloroflexota bacterium]